MITKVAHAVSLALGMGLAASAYASNPIPIDPDGAPGGTPTINVGNLDWAVGNAIAVGVGTFADRTEGQEFQLYAHARLASFNDISNKPINVAQLDNAFEWSYVTTFTERITSVGAGGRTLEFQVNPNGDLLDDSTNFFRIYRSTPNSSDLAGRGFNDGDLILEGYILTGNEFGDSGFNVSGNFVNGAFVPALSALDTFGSNNYNGGNGSDAHSSITGTGSSKINIQVTSWDAATFQNIDSAFVFSMEFNTSQILAYSQTDPSSCFWDGSGFIGGAGQSNPNQVAPCANAIGAVNGISGPDIMFQTDANNNFTATLVPEPGVLALLGISLLGFGIARIRRG